MVIIVKKFPLERCREEYDMDYIIFIIIIAILVEGIERVAKVLSALVLGVILLNNPKFHHKSSKTYSKYLLLFGWDKG